MKHPPAIGAKPNVSDSNDVDAVRRPLQADDDVASSATEVVTAEAEHKHNYQRASVVPWKCSAEGQGRDCAPIEARSRHRLPQRGSGRPRSLAHHTAAVDSAIHLGGWAFGWRDVPVAASAARPPGRNLDKPNLAAVTSRAHRSLRRLCGREYKWLVRLVGCSLRTVRPCSRQPRS